MTLNSSINISIDPNKLVLSDTSRIFKSEDFLKQVKGLNGVDRFLAKLSDGILLALEKKQIDLSSCYIIDTLDGLNSFFFKFGKSIKVQNLFDCDIILYKFITRDKIKNEDKRFIRYIQRASIDVSIRQIQDEDFYAKKLYIISNADKVNFPLLSKDQEKIVKEEKDNVIVQGVAGSGKTNICIDKIVYAAARRYRGKLLYSTYSHSLLEDTKSKVALFNSNIKEFIELLSNNAITFLGKNKKVAIENRLGIWLDVNSDIDIIKSLKDMSAFLENNVDYMLIEDIYNRLKGTNTEFDNENKFINMYLKNIKNYNLKANIDKIKHISGEIIYKEIYGLIEGYLNENYDIVSKDEYISMRKDSFTSQEATIIYMIAIDYVKHKNQNGIIDNNIASRYILKNNNFEKYSLVILDEVQDFTQINLAMFKAITYRMFAVGDALQMINPAYFSFAYLKRLMFDRDYVNVSELRNNYRNSKKIEKIIDNLSELNIEQFGTHNFVIKGQSVDEDYLAKTIYLNDGNFAKALENKAYSDVTIVVNSQKKKQELRSLIPKQEILTISEIKGLERPFVVLYDVLSDNADKWDTLNRTIISKKKAEENSVYRYYFNLFYVGLTRAKQNLFVVERKQIALFSNFFKENFDVLNQHVAFELLDSIASKMDLNREEILERINEFIKLEQYDNARFLIEKLDKDDAASQSTKINIFEKYVRRGENRQAGVELWKAGLLSEAKEQFRISNDEKLIDLIDACETSGSNLEYDIIEFYEDVKDNDVARELILNTLHEDVEQLLNRQKEILNSIKRRR